jgi:uncharacterized Zn-finger protein
MWGTSAAAASSEKALFRPPIRAGHRLAGPLWCRAIAGRTPARRRDSGGRRFWRKANMADRVVPHFHNTPGVAVIEIGAHEFMCEGELAPLDHPHVYLDMGDASEIICPYCSTLFRLDPSLDPHAARPAECAIGAGGP